MTSSKVIAASTTAALTPVVVPKLVPQLGAMGPVVKIAIGAGVAYFTRNMDGLVGGAAFGLGVGLAVDGAADLAGLTR